MEFPMAYFVRARKGDQISPDTDKMEFVDVHSAREEARAAAREILAAAIMASRDDIPDCFIITDGEGREITIVSLGEVLPKALRQR